MRLAVACAAVLALAIPAGAQNPADVKKAAELYDRGKRHFDIAEYTAAIAAWKEAYLLSSEPLLLFNIAQAHRLAGDCAQANRFYLNYKRVQPKPPNQAELDSAMAKCAGVPPATGDTTPTEPASPPNPTTPAIPTTAPPPSPTDPAPPRTVAEAPMPPVRTIDTIEQDQGRTWRLTGLAIGGAGVVAGVIATVYAFRASSRADEIESQKDGTVWSKNLDAIQSEGKSAQTLSRVFGIAGVAAIAAGGGLYWYGRSKSSVRVDVAITPQHSELTLSCAF